jgi:hypothetical protein
MTSLVIRTSCVAQFEDNVAALERLDLTDELAEIHPDGTRAAVNHWSRSSPAQHRTTLQDAGRVFRTTITDHQGNTVLDVTHPSSRRPYRDPSTPARAAASIPR